MNSSSRSFSRRAAVANSSLANTRPTPMKATSIRVQIYAKPRARRRKLELLKGDALARLALGAAAHVGHAADLAIRRRDKLPGGGGLRDGVQWHAAEVMVGHEVGQRGRILALVGVVFIQAAPEHLQVFLQRDFLG